MKVVEGSVMSRLGGWSCRTEIGTGDRIRGKRGGMIVRLVKEEGGIMRLGMRLRGRGDGEWVWLG